MSHTFFLEAHDPFDCQDRARSNINGITVLSALEPFVMAKAVWDRGELICMRRAYKEVIMDVYGLYEDEKNEWHVSCICFFSSEDSYQKPLLNILCLPSAVL